MSANRDFYILLTIFTCFLFCFFPVTIHAQDTCRIIYVRDFGATGDGVTDDTEAVQAALCAAQNAPSCVIFDPGKTYLMQKDVYLYSNTTINLNGATIRCCYPGGIYDPYVQWANGLRFINNKDGLSTAGYGALSNVTIINGTFAGASGSSVSGVTFGLLHASNIAFENITFQDCMAGTHILDLGGCQNVMINHCTFTGAYISNPAWRYREMIQIDSALRKGMPYWEGTPDIAYDGLACQNVVIANCTFQRGAGTHNPNAIGTHTAYVNQCQNITIKNNTFYDCYSYAIRFPKVNHLTILKNKFISQRKKHAAANCFIRLYKSRQAGNDTTDCQNITIYGNSFTGSQKRFCLTPVKITGGTAKPFVHIAIRQNRLNGGYQKKKPRQLWNCKRTSHLTVQAPLP